MGWKCLTCGAADSSDALAFPVMHGVQFPTHQVEPDADTTVRWGRALGRVR